MKSFIAFAALFALAVASPLARTKPAYDAQSELEAIIAAINSPNTDPATAALLEEQLAVIIAEISPIGVGPAIVEHELSPIAVGPEIIDFPVPDGGVVTAEEEHAIVPAPAVVAPSPVVVGEIPAGASPLVQIIVNVNGAQSSPVAPAPVDNAVVDEVYVPGPVNIVDDYYSPDVILEPIQVVEPVVPGPVNVVDNVVVEPIQVVEPIIVEPVQVVEPIVVEPVIVGTPIIPAPAVVLPDTLN